MYYNQHYGKFLNFEMLRCWRSTIVIGSCAFKTRFLFFKTCKIAYCLLEGLRFTQTMSAQYKRSYIFYIEVCFPEQNLYDENKKN